MICKQRVGISNLSRMESFHPQNLSARKRANECKFGSIGLFNGWMGSLRNLLFGAPLCDRLAHERDPTTAQLDDALRELIEMLRIEHGSENMSFRQAERELTDVLQMDGTAEGDDGVATYAPELLDAAVACKRGVLLLGIWRDPEVAKRFCATDPALVSDLQTRVLPLVGPLFLANIGQRPDAFVAMCATMTTLWPGEPFCIPSSEPGPSGVGGAP